MVGRDNRNAKVYGNRIHDNRNCGILYEISFGGTKIHHNTLIDNGIGDGSVDWTMNVQLSVASSDGSRGGRGGIEIYANTIDGDAYPLGLVTHPGRPATKQVHVHDNMLILRATSSRVGGVDGSGTGEMFRPSAGNRFRANTYRVLDPNAAYWAWNGETLTWAQWQALRPRRQRRRGAGRIDRACSAPGKSPTVIFWSRSATAQGSPVRSAGSRCKSPERKTRGTCKVFL